MTISEQAASLARCGLMMLVCAGCNETRKVEIPPFSVGGHDYPAAGLTQYRLPEVLREISGLAVTEGGRLLVHADELGIAYLVDHDQGGILTRYQFGDPPVKDDFEGIAVVDKQIFLVSSTATIYRSEPAGSAEILAYARYPEDLPCEVEGLTDYPPERILLVACKNLHDGDDIVRIYAWDLREHRYLPEPFLSLKDDAFNSVAPGLKKLRPSGITVTGNGNLLLVAREKSTPLLLEVTPQGEVITLVALPVERHPQPEAIGLTHDNKLLLADEGDKRGGNARKGKLGVYTPD